MKSLDRTFVTRVMGLAVRGLAMICFIGAIFLVGFVSGGTIAARKDNAPLNYLFRLTGMMSLLYSTNLEIGPLGVHWNPPFTPLEKNRPITHYEPGRSYPGVNLLLTGTSTGATLVAMDGTELHRWSRRFDDVWPEPLHIPGYEPGLNMYWRRAHLFPNGDILVIFESPDLTPYGLGLAKLDKDSNVLWKFSQNIHHDISVAPDGRIFVLFQEIGDVRYIDRRALRAGVGRTPYLKEGVAILDSAGNLIKKVYLMDALMNSDFFPLFQTMFFESLQGDFTHMNTVQYIDEPLAKGVAFAKAGQVLVSMREMNSIAVLDLDEERVVWSMTGLFQRQHDPQLLPNGHILVFDNFGNTGPGEGATRVREIDPTTQTVKWEYKGTKDDPLQSLYFGSEQRLPNGNTMIVESMNGRVIEVTPGGDVVWQYRVAETRTHEGIEYVPVINDMVRFNPNDLKFLENESSSG